MLRAMVALILLLVFVADLISVDGGCGKRDRVVDVGVVLDANSKMGKQMLAAIEVACRDYDSGYELEVNPRYVNSDGDPWRAFSLAEELIRREEVAVIVWLDVLPEESLFSDMSQRSRIPIISFAASDGSQFHIRKLSSKLKEFRQKFSNGYRRIYGTSEVEKFGPSMHALRAYDCIMAIVRSFDDVRCEVSMKKISEVEFVGLSGPIDLQQVTGLRLWSPMAEKVILKVSPGAREREADRRKNTRLLQATVKKKLQIGVPWRTPFGLFVEEVNETKGNTKYVGFCIEVFLAALKDPVIPDFNYDFVPHHGTYDELVEKVYNQTYDGAVGDITILANRSKIVEFTQPFMESSLSMIVLAKPEHGKRFLFAKPFTPTMWAASGGVLLYTVFVVWALEHGHNGEFSGPPTQQLSTALWFTFSSLFFAQREQVHHTFSRIVLVVWFFVALILTQSYTASLTSMLTLQNIKPSVTTIESLRSNNAPVGCDPKTFVCNYLVNVLHFRQGQIRGITNTSNYVDHFRSGNISALFLESPYEKAFFKNHCQGFINTPLPYRFGGFGFAFPKNSSLADAFSEAILKLSENGNLSTLQHNQFAPGCITDGDNTTTIHDSTPPSLGLSSFWVLYVVSISTSTCCLLVSCLCFWRKHGYLRSKGGRVISSPTVEPGTSRDQENLEREMVE
ncbi:hypothetical protein MLD38_019307 [Melastoma candidum]|uniref:Uncharacterized protein n=1 Tax=Melastoma candidum TaxID=119954 RepID=A0ACB9QX60_9MYRT|nr:hypothetical protein MLD38_019307 [Melastoma candidum]